MANTNAVYARIDSTLKENAEHQILRIKNDSFARCISNEISDC